ncbi:hypothetical protein EDB86DRAFT_583981 [Lactarius hatsudake]|nr:hypothetical protein EDB86DRAFT_583981 [Lactarius hatsudake]
MTSIAATTRLATRVVALFLLGENMIGISQCRNRGPQLRDAIGRICPLRVFVQTAANSDRQGESQGDGGPLVRKDYASVE